MTKKKTIIIQIIIMALFCNKNSYAIGEEFSMGKTIFKTILYFFIFIVFIVFTIYGTKFIAKNSKRFINGKYIQIIDKINLDTNSKIFIVEINKYIYILGLTNNTIEIIDKISKDDFDFMENINFEDHLNKYENKNINNDFKDKFKEISTRCNKIFGKEDENHEK